jgi:O-antigen/teichoic acid export membrane protein
VAGYGARAQLGGVLALLNLRLDFVVLGVLAGPEVVGIYAVASKYAELLRVPSMAVTYVLYPRFAREGPEYAAATVRRSVAPIAAATVLPALVLGTAAPLLIPLLYGSDFGSATIPALILLAGLLGDGIGAIMTAYLYGVGRPGVNSWATATGLVVTIALDLLLIPPFAAVGAAIASSCAYIIVTGFLLVAFRAVAPKNAPSTPTPKNPSAVGVVVPLQGQRCASDVDDVVPHDDPSTRQSPVR